MARIDSLTPKSCSRSVSYFEVPGDEGGGGAGAVAEGVFDGLGELGEGLAVAVGDEEGIVAEAAGAFFLIGEDAFDGAGVGAEDVAVVGEDEFAAETGAAGGAAGLDAV